MSLVPRTALNTLIDDTMRRNDWADDAEVVRRAQSKGAALSKQDLSNFRHQVGRTLVPAKIAALADGLDLPPYVVAVALLSDLGIDVPVDVRTPEAAVLHDHTLSAKARTFLLAIIRADREG